MKPLRARIARALRRVPALAACALIGLLPHSGCMGGSTSEVGNPLTLIFYQDGKRVKFDGIIRIVEAGTNPEFYYDYPHDGTTPAILEFGSSRPAPTWVTDTDSLTLRQEDIEEWLYQREQLPLSKTGAAGRAQADTRLPDFNIILQSSGEGDHVKLPGAWLAGLHALERGYGYSTATGDSGRAFEIDLTPGHQCTGEVDSAAPSGPPLALFVPGSPYYALVSGGRFTFVGLPAGRLPLRWITADGRIFAVPESLGVEGGGPTPAEYAFAGTAHAGERLDSIAMPAPYPTLASPVADPPGPYSFSDSVVVSLSAQAGAVIRYTTDDSQDPLKWKSYTKPLVISINTTLRSIAFAPGYNPSPVAPNNYMLTPARPSISPASGRFVDSVRVTLSGPAGSTLRYTLDGTPPDDASPVYRGPVTLRASAIVQAIAWIQGLGSSAAVSAEYVIETDSTAAP
jgi:hypothetical protein